MSQYLAFEDGRRLRAADLNAELESHETDAARHEELAHLGPPTGRRLAGTSVVHPAGGASVTVVPDGPGAGVRVALGGAKAELEVATGGGHRAAHSVSVKPDVVAMEAVRLRSQSLPTPPVAAPWSIRAVDVRDDDGHLTARELRIELSAPAGSPPQESRVAIGTLETSGFDTMLTVDAAGNVTATGDLAVTGSVSQGEIGPDLEDPRFVALLADLVARRVVGAAETAPDSVVGLSVVKAASSNAGQTDLTASFTPPTRALVRWGAAWESRRGGTSVAFTLVGVGGPVATNASVQLSTPPVRWDPPLSLASPGLVRYVVAAFDAQGTLRAQRVEISVTG